MKKIPIACAFLLGGVFSFTHCIASESESEAGAMPPGAAALGYSRRVIYLRPTTDDISYDATLKNLYSGDWYDPVKPPSTYFMSDGILTMNRGGVLTTESRKSQPGALPLLSAAKGFYVGFAVRLSDNDQDHWPAVWLMPQEHDVHQSDHQPGDPPHYERWMELDINEGGLGSNLSGAYR